MSHLSRNIGVNLVGGSIAFGGQLISIPLALAVCGSGAYGTWLPYFAAAQILSLVDFGAAAATIQYLPATTSKDGRRRRQRVASNLLVIHLTLALVNAASFLVYGVVADLPSRNLLLWGTLTVFAATVARHWQAVNQADRAFPTERAHQIVGILLRLVLLTFGLLLHSGIELVACAELLSLATPGILSGARLRRDPRWTGYSRGAVSFGTARGLLRYGLRWFWMTATYTVGTLAPTAVAGMIANPSTVVAVNAATRVASSLRQVLLWGLEPVVPHAVGAPGEERRRIAVQGTAQLVVFGAALALPIIVLRSPILEVWLGYSAPPHLVSLAATYTACLVLAGWITSLPLMVSVVKQASGSPGYFWAEMLVWALTVCGIYALALERAPDLAPYSFPAAAILFLVLCVAHAALKAPRPVRELTIRTTSREAVWVVAPSLVLCLVAWSTRDVSPPVTLFVSGGAYLIACCLAWATRRTLVDSPVA